MPRKAGFTRYRGRIMNGLEDGYHGEGPKFRDQCNRVGALLGLPPVRTKLRRAGGRRKQGDEKSGRSDRRRHRQPRTPRADRHHLHR
jgi:hypothetical protein